MNASGRDWRRLGCAGLLGAGIAFPAGIMIARGDSERADAGRAVISGGPATGKVQVRDFYSPSLAKDPYVIDQQRRVVEALELACRQHGQRCKEAERARQYIDEQVGSD